MADLIVNGKKYTETLRAKTEIGLRQEYRDVLHRASQCKIGSDGYVAYVQMLRAIKREQKERYTAIKANG